MIKRILASTIEQKTDSGKAIILVGPRQVGKTTLIRSLLQNKTILFLDGDDPVANKLLTHANTEQLRNLIGDTPYVFIDEAQRVENIGLTLKLITDHIPSAQLFVTGSSSFEIGNLMREPLTGRKWEYTLFPVSWKEFREYAGVLKSEQQLPLRLVYGMYPEIITHFGNEYEILKQLAESYLYKDILAFGGIRKPEVLSSLLRALAFQVGSEVSYRELSLLLGVDTKTVSTYIDLLERVYVIFRLSSFSRNLRNEIKRNQKIYFYDNGLLNTVKGNLNPWETREDKGTLWENFLISERMKKNAYDLSLAQSYFWRTKQQQEVDYVEESGGKIMGYEFKWSPKIKVKEPETFRNAYNADFRVIHSENFNEFI